MAYLSNAFCFSRPCTFLTQSFKLCFMSCTEVYNRRRKGISLCVHGTKTWGGRILTLSTRTTSFGKLIFASKDIFTQALQAAAKKK